MNITEIYELPFVKVKVIFRGEELTLSKVLLDTGSASTLLNADIVREIGMVPEGNDDVDIIRGVGGVEYVYTKSLDSITLEESTLKNFQVEIGSMDYGMQIDGILGFNFLKLVGAVIDAKAMEVKTDSY
ncbi:retropepsin-like aspartic protease [Paenibacillus polymyxa]|uniref:retropepsin-like aspartic protease n=1 Tax=Paenibacillus TaxID=44249 RepID=UPI002AB4EC09|nr:retropepsin-like aspartic protease [Paenibacillus polymyxa]MDY8024825.1 retropepsin-like aspartic protease [Paenibacillus polymyxa]